MRALQSSISGSGILGLLGLGGAPGVASNGSILGVLGPTSVGCAPLVGSALGNVLRRPGCSLRSRRRRRRPDNRAYGPIWRSGPEAIVPLRRGADGSLGVASAGAGGKAPTIVINNHTDAQPQVSASSNGDVTVTLRRPSMPWSAIPCRRARAGASWRSNSASSNSWGVDPWCCLLGLFQAFDRSRTGQVRCATDACSARNRDGGWQLTSAAAAWRQCWVDSTDDPDAARRI